MSFRALLVTKDDQAVEALTPVLSNFGLRLHCCGYSDALCLVTEQRFHAVLVDFDDPRNATLVFENLSNARFQNHAITFALLADRTKVRNAFGSGAKFVLYKPVESGQAEGTLRAAASLIRSERRTSFRVPVQVPVRLICSGDDDPIDGILLDLSEEGMDVLASQPLYCSAVLKARFILPDMKSGLELPGEVVWANPNGESGIRFARGQEQVQAALRTWLSLHAKHGQPPEPAPRPDCRLTDISAGGCYVATPSPYPEDTALLLRLRTGKIELEIQGLVCVMHPSYGMGIKFVSENSEQLRKTEEFIRELEQMGGVPELMVTPSSSKASHRVPALTGQNDPLLELLHNHESFSQEMFLEELQSQRRG